VEASAPTSWYAPPHDISIECSDNAFQPSGVVASGKTACGLRVGSQLVAADCTRGVVPPELTVDVYDYTTSKSSLEGSVKGVAGGCQFSTGSTTVNVAVAVGDASGPVDQPASVIVIADFVPPSTNSGSQIARCSQSACIRLGLRTDGEYAIREGERVLLEGNFNQDQVPAPKLMVGAVNRMVLYEKGKTVRAFINGRTIAVGPTSLSDQPGGVSFLVDNHDPKHPVIETLLHLYVFQAG
jgi:hypothetical protein